MLDLDRDLAVLALEVDSDENLELAPACLLQHEWVLFDDSNVVFEGVVQDEDHLGDEWCEVFVVEASDEHHPVVEAFSFDFAYLGLLGVMELVIRVYLCIGRRCRRRLAF